MARTSRLGEPGKAVLCTVPEVADTLAVSRSKVYDLMDAGRLPYVKLGRSRRIRWEDVLKMIEESTVGA